MAELNSSENNILNSDNVNDQVKIRTEKLFNLQKEYGVLLLGFRERKIDFVPANVGIADAKSGSCSVIASPETTA